jgi:alcohol dehydrogenase (NADP+)
MQKAEIEGEGNCIGWCATSESEPLKPWRFPRRSARPNDVVMQITFCGICHSDLHLARGEWGNSIYPMVPGHEIIGVVVETGALATELCCLLIGWCSFQT